MQHYELKFPDYPLRPHERTLALLELRGLLPDVELSEPGEGSSVFLETADLQADTKLQKLAFFSQFRKHETWTPTLQYSLEAADSGRKGARNIRYFAHSLHEYKGRFYPQLGKALLNAVGGGRGVTMDPFCGCGTVLFESALAGNSAVGVDINPIGWMIARAKIASLRIGEKTITRMHDLFLKKPGIISVKSANRNPGELDMDYLRRWFPENNLRKLIQLETTIQAHFFGDALCFLRIVLSEILKRHSWQAQNEQRIRRRDDLPPDDVYTCFQDRLLFHLDKVTTLRKIRKRVPFQVKALLGDARRLPVEARSIDSVVTSPPYATALPYIDADRLSLYFFSLANRRIFCDLERRSIGNREIAVGERKRWETQIQKARENQELPCDVLDLLVEIHNRNSRADVGFRRKNTAALLCKYFVDMRDSMREMHRVLKPDGKVALVVGDNFTIAGDVRVEIPTARFINMIAEKSGFQLLQSINSIAPKAHNIYSKNSIKNEAISLLIKAEP